MKQLSQLGACIGLVVVAAANAAAQTGTPGLAPFDQLMTTILTKYNFHGGSLAVVRDGHLAAARGYGLADVENNIAVQPTSLFRIASLSKTITAVTIMHLVEEGKLTVDQPAFALLPDLQAPPGTVEDPRLKQITIWNLLTHSGGWDDSASGFDPMFASIDIAQSLGVPQPASTENIIRYMRGQPLDFDPGAHYRYSNFGFAVLGRIIEHVTGMSYDQYVRTNILAPMGITNMRIGNTLEDGQLPGEVKYYSQGGTGINVFPLAKPTTVPWPYGGWYMEAMDSHGGWVVSAVDYAKFLDAIDGRRGTAFLKPATVQLMTAKPRIPDYGPNATSWYGFGVEIVPYSDGAAWNHNGSLDGTTSFYLRTPGGVTVVAFFNGRPLSNDRIDQADSDLWNGAWSAIRQTATWPSTDYYSMFPDASPEEAAAVPAINGREGVVNGASFDRGLVPGSWASVMGVNLSKTTRNWTAADFDGDKLPTVLDGVSVTVGGKPAAICYISPTMINFQVPEVPEGWPLVEVTTNGVTTGPVLAAAQPNAPALFLNVEDGVTFAVATQPDGSLIDSSHPAKPGDVIVIYATGLAASPTGVLIDKPRTVPNVEVRIGGSTATVQWAGVVGAGLFQINALVPPTSAGNQPIFIDSNYLPSPANVMIPIAAAQ
jgi:uncharacterized protein (TIGR03437 family)